MLKKWLTSEMLGWKKKNNALRAVDSHPKRGREHLWWLHVSGGQQPSSSKGTEGQWAAITGCMYLHYLGKPAWAAGKSSAPPGQEGDRRQSLLEAVPFSPLLPKPGMKTDEGQGVFGVGGKKLLCFQEVKETLLQQDRNNLK